MTPDDINEVAVSLFSPTTWVVKSRGITSPEKLKTYLETFIKRQETSQGTTLVARINETGEVAAMSTFYNAPENFTRVEIGFTWVADKWMRTFVNTEMKFLMLNYAFEFMKVCRVEFSADPINEKSNVALNRIGAKFEGTLRKWRIFMPGDRGDRNIYSILDDEWSVVKKNLQLKLRSTLL